MTHILVRFTLNVETIYKIKETVIRYNLKDKPLYLIETNEPDSMFCLAVKLETIPDDIVGWQRSNIIEKKLDTYQIYFLDYWENQEGMNYYENYIFILGTIHIDEV